MARKWRILRTEAQVYALVHAHRKRKNRAFAAHQNSKPHAASGLAVPVAQLSFAERALGLRITSSSLGAIARLGVKLKVFFFAAAS